MQEMLSISEGHIQMGSTQGKNMYLKVASIHVRSQNSNM
jgi:hypothetical protein